jgi:hypothetical protein
MNPALAGGTLCAAVALAAAGFGYAQQAAPEMSFFITSAGSGKGADLGAIEGADRHCQSLAAAAGAGKRTWRAYLSATAEGGRPAVPGTVPKAGSSRAMSRNCTASITSTG